MNFSGNLSRIDIARQVAEKIAQCDMAFRSEWLNDKIFVQLQLIFVFQDFGNKTIHDLFEQDPGI